MKTKISIITLFLITGFGFQNCNPYDIDCGCPSPIGEYFDIEGITLSKRKSSGTCCTAVLQENEEISFSDFYGIVLQYEVRFHSSNHKPQNSWGFSLINSAYACSCVENGWLGSKEEKINNLSIITLNDFDDNHIANEEINDLFEVRTRENLFDLTEYLAQDTSLIEFRELDLKLKQAPVLNDTFAVKIMLELSTQEVYESESIPVIISN